MSDSGIRIDGIEALLDRVSEVGQDILRRGADALYRQGELIMTEAKLRTPVDTGALRNSGLVDGPEKGPNGYVVALTFGGPSLPYAIHVHENLQAAHPIGQAKFLESTVTEASAGLAARIAEDIGL